MSILKPLPLYMLGGQRLATAPELNPSGADEPNETAEPQSPESSSPNTESEPSTTPSGDRPPDINTDWENDIGGHESFNVRGTDPFKFHLNVDSGSIFPVFGMASTKNAKGTIVISGTLSDVSNGLTIQVDPFDMDEGYGMDVYTTIEPGPFRAEFSDPDGTLDAVPTIWAEGGPGTFTISDLKILVI